MHRDIPLTKGSLWVEYATICLFTNEGKEMNLFINVAIFFKMRGNNNKAFIMPSSGHLFAYNYAVILKNQIPQIHKIK